jgi:hypothetical protein
MKYVHIVFEDKGAPGDRATTIIGVFEDEDKARKLFGEDIANRWWETREVR